MQIEAMKHYRTKVNKKAYIFCDAPNEIYGKYKFSGVVVGVDKVDKRRQQWNSNGEPYYLYYGDEIIAELMGENDD